MEQLEEAREAMIFELVDKMPAEHRDFLISFKEGNPDWSVLDIPVAKDLPGVRWKQHNLDKLPTVKRTASVKKLREVLGRK